MGEEAQRLQQEEQASRSFIKNIHRVLMPTRGGANVQLAASWSATWLSRMIYGTALFAVSDKAQAPSSNTANIKDIAAEEAIASVVEEMELPADMTYRPRWNLGAIKPGHSQRRSQRAMT